jgi:hypothetical protein
MQQRNELSGGWERVLDKAVMAQFFEFFDSQSGGAKNLDGRPGPKTAVFFQGEVPALRGVRACW